MCLLLLLVAVVVVVTTFPFRLFLFRSTESVVTLFLFALKYEWVGVYGIPRSECVNAFCCSFKRPFA